MQPGRSRTAPDGAVSTRPCRVDVQLSAPLAGAGPATANATRTSTFAAQPEVPRGRGRREWRPHTGPWETTHLGTTEWSSGDGSGCPPNCNSDGGASCHQTMVLS